MAESPLAARRADRHAPRRLFRDARQQSVGGLEQAISLSSFDEGLAQEGLVGGVLQQAADQIRHAGQQLPVRAI